MRHPVILSTIEEDFRAIGLLTDDTRSAAERGRNQTEGRETEGGGELSEMGFQRTKRHTASEKRKWRVAKRKGSAKSAARRYRNKSSVKRMRARHQDKADRMRHGKPAGRRRATFDHVGNISNMLEQAQDILSSLNEDKEKQSIQAFANVAIIAELLSKAFTKFASDSEGKERKEWKSSADFFESMAEEAAEIAKGLESGSDEDLTEEVVAEAFKDQMANLIEGLKVYSEVTDEDTTISEGDDDEDEEGEEGEEGEDDDDDDDDEKETKMPPFMKGKGKGKAKS